MAHEHVEKAYGFLEVQVNEGRFDCFIGEDRALKNAKLSPLEVGSSLLALEAGCAKNIPSISNQSYSYMQKATNTTL